MRRLTTTLACERIRAVAICAAVMVGCAVAAGASSRSEQRGAQTTATQQAYELPGNNAAEQPSSGPRGLARFVPFLRKHQAAPEAERSSVPAIAQLLGVRVGVNGQKKLERVMGEGRHMIGGHPNSHEVWQTASPAGTIETEGFSLNEDGYVVESLSWSASDSRHTSSSSDFPLARKLPSNSGWLGTVNLGMTKQDVERLTKGKLPAPAKRGEVWVWKAQGFVRPKFQNGQPPFQLWTATLRFKHDRLTDIEVECQ